MEATIYTAIDTKGKWTNDAVHSDINFSVSHLVISKVNGTFESYSGNLNNETGEFKDSKLEFDIQVDSINTKNEMRDNHLKSDDFFNAEKHPTIHFVSTHVQDAGEGKFLIKGDLSIREITKEVVWEAYLGGTAVDGYGNTKLGLEVSTTINRFDYNLKWNQLTETGGFTVGKDISIIGNLQFAKQ
jgi:polyisoprenoid-binding protein YceI